MGNLFAKGIIKKEKRLLIGDRFPVFNRGEIAPFNYKREAFSVERLFLNPTNSLDLTLSINKGCLYVSVSDENCLRDMFD
jgi:hypothetical protein